MTITLTETDIAAYRTRVDNHNRAVKLWVTANASDIATIMSRSESDGDRQHALLQYFGNNPPPRLSLFDL